MIVDYRIERWDKYHAPNPAMLRLQLANEGYSVAQWMDGPGTFYGDHKNDTDQCHWVVSGSLEIVVESCGTFVLEAGDRDYLPRETYHTARVISEELAVYFIGDRK